MTILLLRIFGPQLAGLAAFVALRLLFRHVTPLLRQLAAILVTASVAAWIALTLFHSLARIGAYVSFEVFIGFLAQLLIVAAHETSPPTPE